MKKNFLVMLVGVCMVAVIGCAKGADDIPTIDLNLPTTTEPKVTTGVITETTTEDPMKDFWYIEENYALTIIRGVDSGQEELIVPETLHGKEIGAIKDGAFRSYDNLKKVVWPSKFTIGKEMFKDCISLIEVEIPEGVTKIGLQCFEGCTSLRTIVIPEGVTEIGSTAFTGCTSLKEITLPASLTSIDEKSFLIYSGEKNGIAAGNLEDIIVYAPAGSYAEEWARGMGYAVIPK